MSEPRTPRRSRLSAIGILLVLLVIGALIGAVAAVVRAPTYTSEAQLSWDPSVRAQIDPDYAAPDATTFDRQVADQSDAVLSDGVIDAVASTTGLDAAVLRDTISVTTTAGSSVFVLDASADTAAQAKRIAQATTTAYVASLRAANTTTLKSRIGALTPAISQLRKQLAATTTAAAAAPLATDIAGLQSQSASYTAALAAVPVEATVLRTAETPTAPSSPGVLVSLLIGAAIGVVLAVCIVLLLNSLPSRAGRLVPLLPVREPSRTRGQEPATVAAPAAAAPAAVAPKQPASAAGASDPLDDASEPSGAEQPEDVEPDSASSGDRARLTPASPRFFE